MQIGGTLGATVAITGIVVTLEEGWVISGAYVLFCWGASQGDGLIFLKTASNA